MASAILIFTGMARRVRLLVDDRRGTTPLEYAVFAVFGLMLGVTLLISADADFQKPIDQMANTFHKMTPEGGSVPCGPSPPPTPKPPM